MKVIRLLTAILTLAVAAQPQTSRGTVSGTVADPSGAVVTRASVALTNGTNNFDASLFKTFAIGEHRRLEFRWEAQNAFNHPQFVQAPERNVVDSPAGRFLSRDFTDSGIRSMWVQVKVLF